MDVTMCNIGFVRRNRKEAKTEMNYDKLCDYLISRGIKKDWLSEKLGISRTALAYKLKGERPFTHKELRFFYEEFRLSKDELVTIFFE